MSAPVVNAVGKCLNGRVSLLSSLRGRATTFLELLRGLGTRGRWWLIPLIVALVALAGLLLVLVSQSPVAPFIYTVF